MERYSFTGSSAGKESTFNARGLSLIPGLRKTWRRERLPTPVGRDTLHN